MVNSKLTLAKKEQKKNSFSIQDSVIESKGLTFVLTVFRYPQFLSLVR